MKFVQRLLMGIGGMAAAAALLTTVSPKAHAVVATLVQVVNTRSTPVPNQDVDIPGRHPYQQSCVSGTFLCTMPAVPPNTELVIQTVSLTVIGSGSLNDVLFSTVGGGNMATTYLPLVPVGGAQFVAIQAVTQYADPGTEPVCNSQINPSTFVCSIVGYTVSLP
jgi:hypothetical protein